MKNDAWVCECCGQEGTIVAEADDGLIIEIEEPIADPYALAKDGKLHPNVKEFHRTRFLETVEVGDIVRLGRDGYWSTSNEIGTRAKVILIDHGKSLIWIRAHFEGDDGQTD